MRLRSFTLIIVGLAVIGGCDRPAPPAPKPADQALPTFSEPTRGRLALGERVPNLDCAGWINGEFSLATANDPTLFVVDAWSSW